METIRSVSATRSLRFYQDPYLWGVWLLISLGLLIIGWGLSYPVLYAASEIPVMQQVSLVFWVGLWLSLIGLGSWVTTARSSVVPWLASILFVVVLTAPQFLYVGWGSDAGNLAEMTNYARSVSSFNLARDISTVSYFQWPASIFYHRFLLDAFNIDSYAAAKLGMLLTCFCVGSGIYLLARRQQPGLRASRAAFWSVVMYFAGFYWFFNWQATPYSFALALFIPALALIEQIDLSHRILLLLIVVVGLESHALFGVWLILISAGLIGLTLLRRARRPRLSWALLALLVVAQVALIIYKNTQFLHSIYLNASGYYNALLELGASDRAVARQVDLALNNTPPDLLGQVLKFLGYMNLQLSAIIFLLAVILILRYRKLRNWDLSLLAAGGCYFAVGVVFAAIGTRALQLIALPLVFFIAEALQLPGKSSSVIAGLCVISLLLFPSSLIRSYQTGGNYVRPLDLAVRDFTGSTVTGLAGNTFILGEGVRPIAMNLIHQIISPSTASYWPQCAGAAIIIDSRQLRDRLTANQSRISQMPAQVSTVYDAGLIKIRALRECRPLLEALK